MEFNQIRYFLAVCDHLNFTRAAETCAVSQPALTVAIRKLEEELGGALFDRGAGVAMTALGREMREHFAVISRTRDVAKAAANEITRREAATLDIGVSYTVANGTVERIVAGFAAQEPMAQIILHDVRLTRYQELLRAGVLDAAIVGAREEPRNGFTFTPFFRDPFVLAMAEGNPLARKNKVRLQDLSGAPYLDRLRCDFRTDVIGQAAANGCMLNGDISGSHHRHRLILMSYVRHS